MEKHSKVFSKVAVTGFGLFLISIIAVLLAPLGSRIGVWSFDGAVVILKIAAYSGIASACISIVGAIISRPGGSFRGFLLSISVIIIFIPTLLFLLYWKDAKENLPPIQDITTNTEKPPQFWAAPNSKVYGGIGVAVYQEEFYPDIKPLILSVTPEKVFDLSLEVIKQKGWQLWEENRAEKHIEATETTFWFGFSDDVVIHITKTESGETRVDVRSTSRFGGGGDGGTNANRIRSFMTALKKLVDN
ncbi:MAG: DUF1499 domain-containing protein [Gammaproteobacteria bacterium]